MSIGVPQDSLCTIFMGEFSGHGAAHGTSIIGLTDDVILLCCGVNVKTIWKSARAAKE